MVHCQTRICYFDKCISCENCDCWYAFMEWYARDSHLAIQCTWSSYRNNWICYKGWECRISAIFSKGHCSLTVMLVMWTTVLINYLCPK